MEESPKLLKKEDTEAICFAGVKEEPPNVKKQECVYILVFTEPNEDKDRIGWFYESDITVFSTFGECIEDICDTLNADLDSWAFEYIPDPFHDMIDCMWTEGRWINCELMTTDDIRHCLREQHGKLRISKKAREEAKLSLVRLKTLWDSMYTTDYDFPNKTFRIIPAIPMSRSIMLQRNEQSYSMPYDTEDSRYELLRAEKKQRRAENADGKTTDDELNGDFDETDSSNS